MTYQTMTPQKKLTIFALVFMSGCLLLASLYIKEKQEDYRAAVMVKLAEQETKMVRFSELIDRESADSVVERVVKDCPIEDRKRFDDLLGRLSQLYRTELVEIDRLFPACGSFFSDRQAVLMTRLTREIEVYDQYLELLALTSTDTTTYTKRQELWHRFGSIEEDRSDLASRLVAIQGEIIDLLLEGKTVASEEINQKLEEAQSTKDSLSLLGTQADTLRLEISAL